ncbi:EAL domain-containing protein [Halomonas daqingensis]|uniref:cyclic-guanylate-specific phosphodiesterase n=1 Tax=Billgrantia desiderata TaxID=52021 RepID=A0AAW4YSU9_9GAMM|nr:EAL domain-containing protein [Halomonas desiderata]MCE8051757.1 EAL domain-containing protein [Halomonas desiderata]
MIHDNRDLALQSGVYILLLCTISMGFLGLVLSLQDTWTLPSYFSLSTTSALAMAAAGAGLLCLYRPHPIGRWLAASVLAALGLYSLMHAFFHAAGIEFVGWEPFSWVEFVLFGLLVACLLISPRSDLARPLWLVSGSIYFTAGMLTFANPWPELSQAHYAGSTVLPLLLEAALSLGLGVVLALLAIRPLESGTWLGRRALTVGGLGVLASTLCWHLLTWQQHVQHSRVVQQELVHLVDTSAVAIQDHEALLSRLAHRWLLAGGMPARPVRELEFRSYLQDTPSLQTMAVYSQSDRPQTWRRARLPEALLWLDEWLVDPETLGWLSELSPGESSWRFPDEHAPAMGLFAIRLQGPADLQLVASLDLVRLFESPGFQDIERSAVHVYHHGRLMLELGTLPHDHGSRDYLVEELATHWLTLEGGVPLSFVAYSGPPGLFSLTFLLPLMVGVFGLALTHQLMGNLALMAYRTAWGEELSSAKEQLEEQHRVQAMIVNEQPLGEILQQIGQMLEQRIPGAHSAIIVCDMKRAEFERLYSASLPDDFNSFIAGLAVGPEQCPCGLAGYRKAPVVVQDIGQDKRWPEYRRMATQAGFRSVESYPILSSQDRLLGTFALLYREAGGPNATCEALLKKFTSLIELAIERHASRVALHESEQRFRSLFTQNPDAVIAFDLSGNIEKANSAAEELIGLSEGALLGKQYSDLLSGPSLSRAQAGFSMARLGHPERYTLDFLSDKGKQYHLLISLLPTLVNGEVVGVYGIAKDITERTRGEQQLRVLERSLEASHNGVIIAEAGADIRPIIYVNPAFTRITGYQRREVLGRDLHFLEGPETDREVENVICQSLAEDKDIQVTLRHYRKNGQIFWNQLYLSPVRDSHGYITHYVAILNDISEQKAQEQHLAYHATHDALTGLANRSLLEERLSHDLALSTRRETRLAVLFIDLDEFKPVNDTLGHALGDQLLIQVARRLSEALRTSDTLARFGGDEFVVLLPDVSLASEAIQVSERLIEEISRPYRVADYELSISASIGVTLSDGTTYKPEELIQQADIAMYKAKRKGRRNCQLYTPDMNDNLISRLTLRNDLDEALLAEQFELHYQPLLKADGSLCGVEALVRWHHPVKGPISPAAFIPLAEETGQIIPLGRWIMRRACEDFHELRQQGLLTGRVAVNLSPLQFHRNDFLASLRDTLGETELPADALELELTEGILLEDTEVALSTLHALRRMNISVAVDDFGTGYSSLSYLRHLPIDKIKIDRSFVRDVAVNPKDAALVQGIVTMAHSLGLKVVAEGIETTQQQAYLAELGCDIYQGLLFARPMARPALEEWLRSNDHVARHAT